MLYRVSMSTFLQKLVPCKIRVRCGECSHSCLTANSPTTSLAITEVIENRRGSHYHKFRMSTLHAITLVVQAAVTKRNWHKHHNPSYKLPQYLMCQRIALLQGKGVLYVLECCSKIWSVCYRRSVDVQSAFPTTCSSLCRIPVFFNTHCPYIC
jgi:hypothetical protein